MEPNEVKQNLVEERARAWEELKHKLVEAEERGELTQEDREYKDRVHQDLDRIDSRLKLIAEREEAEKQADEARAQAERFVRPNLVTPTPEMDEEQRLLQFFKGEAQGNTNNGRAFDLTLRAINPNEFKFNSIEARTLQEATAGAGGATFNTSFRRQLYQHLVWHSAVRQTRATVLNTDSGEGLILPKTTAHPSAGTIVAEAAAIGTSDPTFGQATLNAYKYAQLIQVSRELLTDTQVDLLGYLASIIGRRLGDGMGADFVTGSGSSKPAGFLNSSVGAGTVAKVTGGTGQSGIPVSTEIFDIYHKVSPPYRVNAEWFMSDNALKNIRELKATTGQFLWGPGLQYGAPNTLLDRPYVTDPNMADCATSATSIAFGDFSTYFIRDVGGLRFERSDDYAFNTDLVTFRAIWRTDGRILDTTGSIGYYVGGTA